MDHSGLFLQNLTLIDRVIAGVCRRGGLYGADAEDFASAAKLALIENDYAILHKWEGRSSLAGYLTVVIQRLLADERMRTLGRWHASAEASRMGDAGVLLETLIRRDRRPVEEVLPIVRGVAPALTREDVERMAARFRQRTSRPRPVELETADLGALTASDRADGLALTNEARRLAQRVGAVVRTALAALPLEDRMVIKLRFGSAMTLAEVSRMLRLPQRPLYRRIEALLGRLRRALLDAGIDLDSLDAVLGSAAEDLDLGLGGGKTGGARQSLEDGMPAATRESS
jgi:RNA polymerase sigma factor for flagellar operon FliA